MRILVFAYDFPHIKTNIGIDNLISNCMKPVAVIAQPYKNLNLPKNKIKFEIDYKNPEDTKIICKKNNLTYFKSDHNSIESIKFIKEIKPDVGVILGARIISYEIINLFNRGIINIHHGFIPENRGLNTMQWAILRNQKQAVTSHMIDKNIDMGEILEVLEVPVNSNDELVDIYNRISEYEQKILLSSLKKIKEGYKGSFICSKGNYNDNLTLNNLEKKMIEKFEDYKKQYPNLNRYPR